DAALDLGDAAGEPVDPGIVGPAAQLHLAAATGAGKGALRYRRGRGRKSFADGADIAGAAAMLSLGHAALPGMLQVGEPGGIGGGGLVFSSPPPRPGGGR